MANTYTQIHIHAIFAVQNRVSLIADTWKDELYAYIMGIIKENGHKPLAIGGTADHIHLFFGLRPAQSLSNLMQDIKGSSSKWINEKRFVQGKFSWQEGYAAFSYAKSQLKDVVQYIENQTEHHHKTTFIEEFRIFLQKFDVEYDDQYIFKPIAE
jgi:REP element-mobilizing transposase RayT